MKNDINTAMEQSMQAMPCILCGAFTKLNDREKNLLLAGMRPVKVCQECRAAVAFAKRTMKNSE